MQKITGASKGIGRALALQFAKLSNISGLVLVARSTPLLTQLTKEINHINSSIDLLPMTADLIDHTSPKLIIDQTIKKFGRIDSLIHNAGMSIIKKVVQQTMDEQYYEQTDVFRVFQLNVMSAFQLTHYAIPYLRKSRGSILYVSSSLAKQPEVGLSLYCSTKAALNIFAKVMAKEEPEITSIIVGPGMTDTDMASYSREYGINVFQENFLKRFTEAKENNQLNKPEDVAKAFCAIALHAPKEWSGSEVENWRTQAVEELIKKINT
jgi:NAD(P)-dependent dehydrogenase (short-subunit alcohol dehydrogenase family)